MTDPDLWRQQSAAVDALAAALGSATSPAGREAAAETWLAQAVTDSHDLNHTIPAVLERLLDAGDREAAGALLWSVRRRGLHLASVSAVLFRMVIEPDLDHYRARFEANLALLDEYLRTPLPDGFTYHSAVRELQLLPYLPEEERRATPQLKGPAGRSEAVLLVDPSGTFLLREALTGTIHLAYLVFDDPQKLAQLLLFEDLAPLRRSFSWLEYVREPHRLLIFARRDQGAMRSLFDDLRVRIPTHGVDFSQRRDYADLVRAAGGERLEHVETLRREAVAFCQTLTHEHYARLFSTGERPPKVMIITTRRGEISYSICLNWANAFRALGYNVHIAQEAAPFHYNTSHYFLERLASLRPDMLFVLNCAVAEVYQDAEIQRSLLCLARFRDFVSITGGLHTVDYENTMFFVASVPIQLATASQAGMPAERMMYVPDGVDVSVFHPREATDTGRYGCDVVSVSNNACNDAWARTTFLESAEGHPTVLAVLEVVCDEIEEMARAEQFLFFPATFEKLLAERLERAGIGLPGPTIIFLAAQLREVMISHYRRKVMEWIIRSGITPWIKVWGRNWKRYPIFAPYDMGPAAHGEELSTIYQNSKISISDHGFFTLHERNFEIYASGGFPLIKGPVPEGEWDVQTDVITNYFLPDEEVVLFYERDDLLQKVAYYLEHSDAREMVAAQGRAIVRRQFTTVALAESVMKRVAHYFTTQSSPDGSPPAAS